MGWEGSSSSEEEDQERKHKKKKKKKSSKSKKKSSKRKSRKKKSERVGGKGGDEEVVIDMTQDSPPRAGEGPVALEPSNTDTKDVVNVDEATTVKPKRKRRWDSTEPTAPSIATAAAAKTDIEGGKPKGRVRKSRWDTSTPTLVPAAVSAAAVGQQLPPLSSLELVTG